MTSSNNETPQSVVFVDSQITDYQAIVAAIDPGVKVIVYDGTQDGLAQIAQDLQGVYDLASVDIISHGAADEVQVGTDVLTTSTIPTYTADLAAIGNALAPNGQLDLYGCDVAAAGDGFLTALQQATGRNVAASTDPIGATVLGGTWTLDATTGPTPYALPANPAELQAFDGLLLTTPAQIYFDTYNGHGGGVIGQGNMVEQVTANGSTLVGSNTIINDGSPINPNGPDSDPYPALTYTTGFVVDAALGKYFIASYNGTDFTWTIQEGSLSGGGLTTLYTDPLPALNANDTPSGQPIVGTAVLLGGLALDAANGDLYFARDAENWQSGDYVPADTGIYEINVTGGAATLVTSATAGLGNPLYMTLDTAANLVFFDDAIVASDGFPAVENLDVANLTTGAVTVLESFDTIDPSYFNLQGLAVDTANSTLYLTAVDYHTSSDNAIYSIPFSVSGSGSTATASIGATTTLYSGAGAFQPTDIVVDAQAKIFYTSGTSPYTSPPDVDDQSGNEAGVFEGSLTGGSTLTEVFAVSAVLPAATPATGDAILDTYSPELFLADVAPVVTAGATATFDGGGSAVTLDSGLMIETGSSATLASATVTLSSGELSIDILSFNGGTNTETFSDGDTITASYSAGVLTLSGTAEAADYQTALAQVQFSTSPSNADPTSDGSDTSRTISWVVNDGTSDSIAVTSTLDTMHVAPTVTAGASVNDVSGGSAVVLDSALTVTDVDSGGNLTGAKVSIVSPLTGDTLSFIAQNNITESSYTNGVLTLTGKATVQQYEAALGSITFGTTSTTAGDRTVDWQVSDGSSSNGTSAVATSTVDVVVPPTIGGTGNTAQFYQSQGSTGTPLDGGQTLTDGVDIASATVTISTGFQSGDTLSFDNGSATETFSDSATVTASQSGDVLTLTTTAGNATAADYQKALDSVTYSFSGDPTIGGTDRTRTITWSLTDANGLTSVPGSTSTLDVYMTPVLAGTVSPTPTVTATSGAVPADSSLTVTDDNTIGTTPVATVTITSGSLAGDELIIPDGDLTTGKITGTTITVSNNDTTSLTLMGTSTTTDAQFQSALRDVEFDATSPHSGPRQLTWSFNDDAGGNANDSNSLITMADAEFGPILATTADPNSVTLSNATPTPLADTATVSGGTSPTGSVTFTLMNPLGAIVDTESVTVTGDGSYTTPTGYTLPTTGTVAGTYQWDASYSGDSNNAATSDNNNFNEQVVVSAANPSISTSQQTASATVDTTIAVQATVTGLVDPNSPDTVTFNLYSSATVQNLSTLLYSDTEALSISGDTGTATSANYTATATGTDYWVATYNGDANNDSVTSGADVEPITVTPATPTVTTSQLPASATVDTPVSDTATVSGGFNPTGTVTFDLYNNSNGAGTPLFTDANVALVNGTATSAGYIATVTGTDYWVATYNGDANNSSVTSGIALEPIAVTPATPTVTTSQQPTSATVDTPVSDTATVSGGFNPTGTVTFNLYNNSNGTGTPLFTDANIELVNGTATSANYIATATGTDYWIATYNGDANNSAVNSGANIEPVTVTPATPTVTTSQQPPSATVGSTVADQASVSGGFNPTGTVTFSLYNNPNGTGTPLFIDTEALVGGVATSGSYTATAIGTDYWVATYNGDANNSTVTSADAAEPVSITPTTPSISSSQQPAAATVGTMIADQATVSGFIPTGTVTFELFDNSTGTGTPLFTATENLVNGVATSAGFTPAATGTDYWVATYSGDANNTSVTSADAAEPVTISAANPTLSTTPSTTAVSLGLNPVTLKDTADLASGSSPTGTITFTLFENGGTTPVDTETATVTGNGTYTTPQGYTLPSNSTAIGTYQWDATYSGDTNNNIVNDTNNSSEQVTVSPGTPTVTAVASSVNASASESFTPAQLFSASDAAGEPILTYEVEDETTGSSQGFWVLNGAVLPNGQITTLTAAQLSALSFVAGSASSPVSDTLEVAASDAAGLGAFTTFTVTAAAHAPTTPPTVTAANELQAPNLALAGSSLFLGTAFGNNTITSYEVEDTTTDSGHWMFNGVVEPTNQVIDVTVAQLAQLSFDTGYGSDNLMVRANDGTQWGNVTSFTVMPPPSAASPAGTTATLVMQRISDGAYEFYDIGHNTILLDGPLGAINPALQVAGVGGFDGADTADLLMRDPTTAVFTLYDVSNNNITGNVVVGQVGLEWTVSGIGDFSTRANETDMLMRNSNTGQFEVFDIANNAITFAGPMGQVGPEWSVAGFGDFSTHANETDMLMRNSNTGAFEVYDISNNAITSSAPMGQVGLEWTIAGFGDFSGNANETDMLMRNGNTGAFEVFDIANNAITSSASMGQVGLEWTIAGFSDFSGNANETDMLMRNSNTGVFELYDINNNAIAPMTTQFGQVGLEWSISGVSVTPASAPPTTQLTQAMASFAPSAGTLAASSPLEQTMAPAAIGTALLTTNHA